MSDTDPVVRRRATGLAADLRERADRALLEALTRALDDPDPSVAEIAAWALGEWGPVCGLEQVKALSEITRGHPDALCREAAVAALGAISNESGLPAVLRALEDKPAIRRRATIALAAFEGPLVDEALRRSLEDRDWQVREAAEEILEEATEEATGDER